MKRLFALLIVAVAGIVAACGPAVATSSPGSTLAPLPSDQPSVEPSLAPSTSPSTAP